MDDSRNQFLNCWNKPINANRIMPISIILKAIEYAENNGNHKTSY